MIKLYQDRVKQRRTKHFTQGPPTQRQSQGPKQRWSQEPTQGPANTRVRQRSSR